MSLSRLRAACYGALLMAFGAVTSGAEPDPVPSVADAPVQALWRVQEVEFYFQSFTTFYSCSSLEAKVKRLLVAVGAQRDLKIRTRGCFASNEIARMPLVQIEVTSPAEATPELLAEFDKTRSTRELVARVRGDSKQAEVDEEQFPAEWKRVSLSRGKLGLEPGDCELIEQLKKKVFPKLAIRLVDDDVECVPNRISMTQPRLVVDALTPLPKADDAAAAGNKKSKNGS